jgi:hypothetical protein
MRQGANGVGLAQLAGRRCDRTGAGLNPGHHSVTEKKREPEASRDPLASAQRITAQLLIASHPLLLGNEMGRVFVHRSFF